MFETKEIRGQGFTRTVTASIQSDVGCIRDANEDSGRHVVPKDGETLSRRGTLTIVADGMGGHSSGEVASQMAIEFISKYYYGDTENPPQQALANAIQKANEEIYVTSVADEKYYGMGTTIIALALLENEAFSAHVGDSRLYQKNGRDIDRLTIDHSQVMEMVREGLISLEEAETHEDKNVILRALGTQPVVEVEVSDAIPVNSSHEFLLCSDGLCDMLSDKEILAIWFASTDIHEATRKLIEAAKLEGGHDNVTVGIVRIAPVQQDRERRTVKATREITRLEQ